LVRAQRKIFWLTMKLPLIFLVLSSIPGAIYFGSQTYAADSPPLMLYLINWVGAWAIFALQLETIAMMAMLQAAKGRKPMNAALRTLAIVTGPGLLLGFMLPLLRSVTLRPPASGISGYFVLQFVLEVLVAIYLSVILHRARVHLNLRPPLLSP
ncbi:MAG: hypothetical protein ACXW3Z_11520, partial [Limisphaerales bacterium]